MQKIDATTLPLYDESFLKTEMNLNARVVFKKIFRAKVK